MCTLLLGWRIPGLPGLLVAANRDEDPARPSEGPQVLRDAPRVAGGRDARAGGTWLAIRERRAVVAILNRRPRERRETAGAPHPGPSRGLLAIEVAAAGDGEPRALAVAARLLLGSGGYAPCSLVVAGPEAATVTHHRGTGLPPETRELAPGWHVITHEDVDDAAEPRTAWLLGELAGLTPHSTEAAFERLHALLATHGGPQPAVCLHEGRMLTVSTAHVALGGGAALYRHGEGPACRATLADHSALLAPETGGKDDA